MKAMSKCLLQLPFLKKTFIIQDIVKWSDIFRHYSHTLECMFLRES